LGISHPVARTAFYCCAIRADDAAAAGPVCGDTLAARFLDEQTRRELQPVLRLPAPAASNVARHRLIDDLLRRALLDDPRRRIIVLGAGFDTRPFRLTGGRWYEIDDPPLLAFKEERLPAASAPNPLTRIPVDFETERLAERLAPLAGDDAAVIVLEGVTMYLDDDRLAALAATLLDALPRATLICDLMSPTFARTFGRGIRAELGRLGASFGTQRGHPREHFERAGYRVRERHSIALRAHQAGTMPVPGLLITLLPLLRNGYAVWVLEPRGPSAGARSRSH